MLWKRHCHVLIGINIYPGYGFAFSTFNASAKILAVNLQNPTFSVRALHTTLLLNKEYTSKSTQYSDRFMSIKFANSWLDRMVEWPLEDAVMVPVRRQVPYRSRARVFRRLCVL